MARPREFDADTALEQALAVFWDKGFEATSVQDLTAAMGIQKASLYGTFGDKRTLYVTALQRYQQQALADLERGLTAPGSPLAALRGVLAGTAAKASGRGGRRGCFCVNANVEVAPHDAAIADLLRRHGEQVEAALADALRRALEAGELRDDADCARLATFLFGALMAINVMARQRAGRARIDAFVEQAMSVLSP